MEALKTYLSNHPQDLKAWLDQFPWESFGEEIIVHEDEDANITIAKKVVLHTNAEVTGLLICQEAEIGEGAEILGTMVCDKGIISSDAECNYLIARTVTVGEDAEIRSAIVLDSLTMDTGAEIDELESLSTTFCDVHADSLIKKKAELGIDEFNAAINLRLQVVLESAINQLDKGLF
jgi:NDP-sugar pyrophosphorylase family protein